MGLTARERRVFDKPQSVQKSYAEAIELNRRKRKRPEDNKKLVSRVRRRLYELYHGKKAYMKKKGGK